MGSDSLLQRSVQTHFPLICCQEQFQEGFKARSHETDVHTSLCTHPRFVHVLFQLLVESDD